MRCDVFLYDELFVLIDVYWIKGGIKFDIVIKGGKYLGVNLIDLLLIINNVNEYDVGNY